MACILQFCDRLEGRGGDHSCELAPGHPEACLCECEECLALAATASTVEVGPGVAVAEC